MNSTHNRLRKRSNTKRGVFNHDELSLQLSVYKGSLEESSLFDEIFMKVSACFEGF